MKPTQSLALAGHLAPSFDLTQRDAGTAHAMHPARAAP
jgi:hypothetical protein